MFIETQSLKCHCLFLFYMRMAAFLKEQKKIFCTSSEIGTSQQNVFSEFSIRRNKKPLKSFERMRVFSFVYSINLLHSCGVNVKLPVIADLQFPQT